MGNHKRKCKNKIDRYNQPLGLTVDKNNNLLVCDGLLISVFKVDSDTGKIKVFSGPGVGNGIGFKYPMTLAEEPDGNFAVSDFGTASVIRVDKNTGNRTVLSGPNTVGPPDMPNWDIMLALDVADNGKIFTADVVQGIFTVDPITGIRTTLSNNFGVGTGPIFGLSAGITAQRDSTNNERILVADLGFGAVVDVNPINGNRSIISGFDNSTFTVVGSGPLLRGPRSLRMDPDKEHIILADQGYNNVLRINLSTGNRVLLNGKGCDMIALRSVGISGISNKMLVIDQGRESIFKVKSNGDHCLFSGKNNKPKFLQPRGIIVGTDGKLKVADLLKFSSVDPKCRKSTIISGQGVGSGIDFIFPSNSVQLDSDNYAVSDFGLRSIVRVVESTGNRSIISGPTRGSGVALVSPQQGIEKDENNVLVTDGGAVKKIKVASGDREVVSGFDPTTSMIVGLGPNFAFPFDISIDSDGNYIVVDFGFSSVFKVESSTGNRQVISGFDPATSTIIGAGPLFTSILSVAIETDGQLIVTGFGGPVKKMYRVDPVSGDRTIFSSSVVSEGPSFEADEGVTIASDGTIYTVDFGLAAVFEVNPLTGIRKIISDSYHAKYVDMDIIPGVFPNVIDLKSTGQVEVLIFGSECYNVKCIKKGVKFAGAREVKRKFVCKDGKTNLLLTFNIQNITELNTDDT